MFNLIPKTCLAVALALSFSTVARSQEKSLALIPVGSEDQHYELFLSCVDGPCSVAIRLVTQGHMLDLQKIEGVTVPSQLSPVTFSHNIGAGDPLATALDGQLFGGGEEEKDVALAIRPVALTPTLNGVLIDIRTGFEHLKRRHQLLAAINGHLKVLWDATENEGPTYSTTALQTYRHGQQRLVYFSFFSSPDETVPDKLDVRSLSYSSDKQMLVPSPSSISGSFAGPFPTSQEANRARAELRKCGASLWVFPSDVITGNRHQYVIATISASSPDSIQAFKTLRSCTTQVSFSPYSKIRAIISSW